MIAALLVAASISPDIHVDVIELNTLIRTEVIEGAAPGGKSIIRYSVANRYWNFWEFVRKDEHRYHVRDYANFYPGQEIRRVDGRYAILLMVNGRRTKIVAPIYIETFCLAEHDPEVLDRQRWPMNKRNPIQGIRRSGLTPVPWSSTLVASDLWRSTGWRPITVVAGSWNTVSARSCVMRDSPAFDPLVPRERSTS